MFNTVFKILNVIALTVNFVCVYGYENSSSIIQDYELLVGNGFEKRLKVAIEKTRGEENYVMTVVDNNVVEMVSGIVNSDFLNRMQQTGAESNHGKAAGNFITILDLLYFDYGDEAPSFAKLLNSEATNNSEATSNRKLIESIFNCCLCQEGENIINSNIAELMQKGEDDIVTSVRDFLSRIISYVEGISSISSEIADQLNRGICEYHTKQTANVDISKEMNGLKDLSKRLEQLLVVNRNTANVGEVNSYSGEFSSMCESIFNDALVKIQNRRNALKRLGKAKNSNIKNIVNRHARTQKEHVIEKLNECLTEIQQGTNETIVDTIKNVACFICKHSPNGPNSCALSGMSKDRVENTNNVRSYINCINHTEQMIDWIRQKFGCSIHVAISSRTPCTKCAYYIKYARENNYDVFANWKSMLDIGLQVGWSNEYEKELYPLSTKVYDAVEDYVLQAIQFENSILCITKKSDKMQDAVNFCAIKCRGNIFTIDDQCNLIETDTVLLVQQTQDDSVEQSIDPTCVQDKFVILQDNFDKQEISSIGNKQQNFSIGEKIKQNNEQIQAWFDERCNIA